jgi:hypothetical protein
MMINVVSLDKGLLDMDLMFPIFLIVIFSILSFMIYQKTSVMRRKKFIKSYVFPQTIRNNVAKTYPHLKDVELDQVMRGLRDYFQLISLSQRKMIAMPSQVVDVAWHEFILFTREYSQFCSKALGRFLHHTPAEAMKSKNVAQAGIKRAWRIACHLETINPYSPMRLPLIFALDTRLNIEDGFHYERDCMRLGSSTSKGKSVTGYCCSHIGCSSGCAGSAGDGGCSGDGGGGGGCGGS